jgi:hypothetical protein
MTLQDAASGGAQGLVMTGEFLSSQAMQPKSRKDGSTWTPFLVRLLVNDQTERIEFGSQNDVDHFLGAAERGDVVSVPVRVRAYQGSVYYSGLRAPRSAA